MKSTRTKFQELVVQFWGYGKYVVEEADLPKLSQYFQDYFSEVLSPDYSAAMMKFLRSEAMTPYERQKKFWASSMLVRSKPEEPDFLKKVEYPEDKLWSLADVAEALFGKQGDTRIYRADIPKPWREGMDSKYTTEEVKEIINLWNNKQSTPLKQKVA